MRNRKTHFAVPFNRTSSSVRISLIILSSLAFSLLLSQEILDSKVRILIILTFLIFFIGIGNSLSTGLKPVGLMFYVFSFGWLGIAPVIQLTIGQLAWGDSFLLTQPELVYKGLMLGLIAFFSFFLGNSLFRPCSGSGVLNREYRIKPESLLSLAFVIIILAPLWIRVNGGPGLLFSTRHQRSYFLSLSNLEGASYAFFKILPVVLSTVFILLFINFLKQEIMLKKELSVGIILFCSVVSIFVIIFFLNPFTNSRFIFGTFFGAVTLTIFKPRSRPAGILVLVIALVSTLIIYPVSNIFRTGINETGMLRRGLNAFLSPDFDGFQQVMNSVIYVQDFGYGLGQNILSALGFFIPRTFWENKLYPASIAVAENAGYSFTDLSLPVYSEFYLEFGVFGVILGMFILGHLVQKVDHAWLFQPESLGSLLAPYLAMATIGIVRGPLGSLIPLWGTSVVLLIVLVNKKTISKIRPH